MQVGRSKAPSLPIKALSFCRPTDTAGGGEGGAVRHQKGESHRRWLITVVLIMSYYNESKSRNADFKNCGVSRHHHPLNLLTPLNLLNPHACRACPMTYKSMTDTSSLSSRLYDQRGEKAWRKGFPIPAVHNPWKRGGKTGNLHEFFLSGAPKTP